MALAVVSQLPPVAPQPERPVFRTGVELVEVDVVAVDAEGRPVKDLRRDEFEVYEDGRQRELVSFALVDLPIPPAHPPRLFDVSTNERAADGRLFFLVLDDVNSFRRSTAAMQATVRHLISRLAPQDQVGLLWVSLKKKGAREFTTNHASVLQAVEEFAAEIATIEARTGFRSQAPPDELPEGGVLDTSPVNPKRFFDLSRPYKIVSDVSGYVASLPKRRKAVIYIGEGLRSLGPKALRNDYADVDLLRALTAARRANVSVYLLDPRAPLRPGAEELFEEDRARDLARLRPGEFGAFAEATGGFSVVSPLVGAQVERILTDTSTYYLLGYYADPPRSKGLAGRLKALANAWDSYRPIEVRTSRPGVRIRARKGYWPLGEPDASESRQPGTVRQEVTASMSGLLPDADLPLRAFAAPFRGRGGKHTVALAVEARDSALGASPDLGMEDTVTLAVIAFEPGEKIRARQEVTLKVALAADRSREPPADRYLLCTSLDLKPGQYQLRIGVHSARSGKAGSVYHDLTVPDFAKDQVSLSGIVLGQTTGAVRMPVARAAAIAGLAPFLPSLVREFVATDAATAFVKIYRPKEARGTPVTVVATITSLETESQVWTASAAAAFSGQDDAEFRVELPLRELASGSYRLVIRGETGDGQHSEPRETDFDVLSAAGSGLSPARDSHR